MDFGCDCTAVFSESMNEFPNADATYEQSRLILQIALLKRFLIAVLCARTARALMKHGDLAMEVYDLEWVKG